MKKRDISLLVGAAAIIIFLSMAPDETTKPVPKDEIHQEFYNIVKNDGKKAAEKFCGDCHNADGVPFPKDHPPKFRCLFCHKIRL